MRKRKYKKPSSRNGSMYEKHALACLKMPGQGAKCSPNRIT